MQHQLTKENWVDMFNQIGLTQQQMKQWHQVFETCHPQGHQAFLSWLGVCAEEITSIRNNSK